MNVKSFLKSKVFFKQVIIAIVLTLVLLYLVMFILRIYTDHGESFAVPDFKGMDIEQAEKMVSQTHLRYVVIDSLFVKDAVPGTIIGQVPEANAQIKKNRVIFFTICTMSPEQVSMPKLTDIAYRQALNVIESSGLEIGKVEYKPSEYTNLVLEQRVFGDDAVEGMLVPKGTRVDLVVGQNFSGEQTEIPDLLGESYTSVKKIMGEVSLNFGAVVFDDSFTSAEDSANAIVWKQRPEPSDNQKIYQGQSIDIWLTLDDEKVQKAIQNK